MPSWVSVTKFFWCPSSQSKRHVISSKAPSASDAYMRTRSLVFHISPFAIPRQADELPITHSNSVSVAITDATILVKETSSIRSARHEFLATVARSHCVPVTLGLMPSSEEGGDGVGRHDCKHVGYQVGIAILKHGASGSRPRSRQPNLALSPSKESSCSKSIF